MLGVSPCHSAGHPSALRPPTPAPLSKCAPHSCCAGGRKEEGGEAFGHGGKSFRRIVEASPPEERAPLRLLVGIGRERRGERERHVARQERATTVERRVDRGGQGFAIEVLRL